MQPAERVLRWAMERSGKPVDVLERSFPKLHAWLAGEEWPTLRQLEQFASATHTPVGALFLDEPPPDTSFVPLHSTQPERAPSAPSAEFRDTLDVIRFRQLWLRHDLETTGRAPLPFVGSCTDADPPELIAERMRRALGFSEGWTARQPNADETLRALRLALERAGVMVAVNSIVGNNTRRRLSVDEFRGFALSDPFAPWLFVNGADGKGAQLFTLAHAFAHVLLGASAAFDLAHLQPADDPAERTCAAAAEEFLLPARRLAEVWPDVVREEDPFYSLARQFRVSVPVAALRACNMGYIGLDDFVRHLVRFTSEEKERSAASGGGGNFYATQNLRVGRAFALRVAEAVEDGRLLYNQAYELTGLRGQTFHNYLQTLDGGGGAP